MRDPRKVFTKSGNREYLNHLQNLENALFFLTNNADDLHLGATEETENFTDLVDQLYQELHVSRDLLETGVENYDG